MMRALTNKLFPDTRGAVMVMGLFLGLFLVGSLFLVVSVGDSLLYRRAMQEGTDAGAFAAAVVAAKGMNLHSALNVAMAATAGVLLVIRTVEVLLEILLRILEGLLLSIVFAPKAAALIGVVTPAEATVEKIGDGVEQFVRASHDALDVAHDGVQYGFPLLAEARAVDSMVLRDSFDPPLEAGFVLPVAGPVLSSGRPGLPVEKDGIRVLCARASNAIGGRIANVEARLPRWLMRFLGGAIARALRLGERRTCAESVVEPPRKVIASRRDSSPVWLGHEEFQYRAFALGENPDGGRWMTGERGVRVGGAHASADRPAFAKLQQAGRFSFAQAEFYHHADVAKGEWLWRLRWRARLRRFGVPRSLDGFGIRTACARVTGRSGARDASACVLLEDLFLPNVSAH